MKNKLHFLVLVFCLGFSSLAMTQDCSITLRNAEEKYNQGNLEQVEAILAPCMQSGFNKIQKEQAYRLLVLTHLFDDNRPKAEENMELLLTIQPEYQINEAIDPIEFIQLHESYRTSPIFSIGFTAGLNKSRVTVLETYNATDLNNANATYTSPGVGFQFGAKANVLLLQNLEASLEPKIKTSKFLYTDTLNNLGRLTSNESHTWFNIPLSFNYEYNLNKISPYVSLGANMGILLSAKSNLLRSYPGGNLPDVTGSAIDLKANRKNVNYSVTFGGGIKYKITKGFLFIDFKYNYSLQSNVDPAGRYNNPELLYKYYYQDNDFTMDNLELSLGYMRSFYKPKKK